MATQVTLPNPPGSYLATSKNVTLTESTTNFGAYILTADCGYDGGQYKKSTLEFGLQNVNGKVEWSPTNSLVSQGLKEWPTVANGIPAGSYLLTCSDVKCVAKDSGNVHSAYTLSGNAQMEDGTSVAFSMDYGIANDNGVLTWNPDGSI
ncbi:MAG: CVNH domain-containing protein [Bacteroidota bacterium]